MATPTNRTPIKLARGSYSNLNSSIDDIQEGEIIYAEDQNKLYVKEGTSLIDVTGSGGGGGGSTNLSNTADGTSLTIESSSGNNTNLPAATTSAWGVMTDEDKTKLDGIATGATGTPEGTAVLSTGETGTTKFLRVDGDGSCSWQVPPDTNTTYSVGDGGLTTKDFTTTLKTKLDGIATGAEVNVQSDWNSSSGDSQILNKPTVPTNLSDLSDVHNATPSDGQVLKWVNAQSRWEPGSDNTGGGGGGATNLSNTADGTSLTIESSSGNNTSLPAATTSAWGVMTDEDKTKLDGIASGATNTAAPYYTSAISVGDGGLTTKDFTTTLKTKLDGIAENATANAGTVTSVTGTSPIASSGGATPAISISAATTTAAGSMSSADKTKLDGIASSANNYTHPAVNHIPTGGSSGQVLKWSSDGTAAWGTDNDTTYSVGDGGLTTKDFTTTLKTKLDGIASSANNYSISSDLLDEDDMSSNSATKVPSQQSVKAYVDANATVNSTTVNSAGAVMNSDLATKGQILIGDGSGDPTALSLGTDDYVLTADSSEATGVKWAAASGGIALSDLSITTNTAGTAALSYNNSNGVFSYTPPNLSGYSTTSHSHSYSPVAGSSSITTVGTIGTGTWQGTAIGDTYISSASTWNAKQAALTFGIANTNAVKIDDASVSSGQFAKFTSSGLQGTSLAKADVGLGNVENTAISSWAGSSNITTLGTVTTLTPSTTTGNGGGSVRKIFYADTGPNPGDGAEGDIWLEY